jgi:hypothetical protein
VSNSIISPRERLVPCQIAMGGCRAGGDASCTSPFRARSAIILKQPHISVPLYVFRQSPAPAFAALPDGVSGPGQTELDELLTAKLEKIRASGLANGNPSGVSERLEALGPTQAGPVASIQQGRMLLFRQPAACAQPGCTPCEPPHPTPSQAPVRVETTYDADRKPLNATKAPAAEPVRAAAPAEEERIDIRQAAIVSGARGLAPQWRRAGAQEG